MLIWWVVGIYTLKEANTGEGRKGKVIGLEEAKVVGNWEVFIAISFSLGLVTLQIPNYYLLTHFYKHLTFATTKDGVFIF